MSGKGLKWRRIRAACRSRPQYSGVRFPLDDLGATREGHLHGVARNPDPETAGDALRAAQRALTNPCADAGVCR